MILSIIVYGLMALVMWSCGKKAYVTGRIPQSPKAMWRNSYYLIPILIFALFSALRWRCGVDCNSYIESYYLLTNGSADVRESIELGYIALSKFFIVIGTSHIPFFFTFASVQIALVYYALKEHPIALAFLGIIMFTSVLYMDYMNAMRQMLAVSCELLAIKEIVNKKYIKALLIVLIAAQFHKTAYLLLPIVGMFYFDKDYAPNTIIQIVCVVISYALIGFEITTGLETYIRLLGGELGYEAENGFILTDIVLEKTFGFRSFLMLFVDLIVIIQSKKMKEFYNSTFINALYFLFFIGTCSSLIFYGNHGLERISMYLTEIRPFVYALCCAYLYLSRKKSPYNVLSIILIIMPLVIRLAYDWYDNILNNPVESVLYKFIFEHPELIQ